VPQRTNIRNWSGRSSTGVESSTALELVAKRSTPHLTPRVSLLSFGIARVIPYTAGLRATDHGSPMAASRKSTKKSTSSKVSAAGKASAAAGQKKPAAGSSAKTTKTVAKKSPAKKSAAKKTAAKKVITKPTTRKASVATKTTSNESGSKSQKESGDAATPYPFSKAFLRQQKAALLAERKRYVRHAEGLKAEADQLARDREPGDVQFDEESGEGDGIAVERERDLALSAQASDAVDQIDAALGRLEAGTYGISVVSGLAIPEERLEAIPHADMRVDEKTRGMTWT